MTKKRDEGGRKKEVDKERNIKMRTKKVHVLWLWA
jgi:hypothetical protein